MLVALPIGSRPTPLDPLHSLGRELGIELYLKRDDRIDDIGCGTKVRKLAYQLAEAAQVAADVVVTCGSAQSNQCKAVAAYAPIFGMQAHLVYGGDEQVRPRSPTGNYLIAALMAPAITWCERWPWPRIEEKVREVADAHVQAGRRVHVVGPGGPVWPSLLGAIELGGELIRQMEELGHRRGHIVAVAGTGETCAGLAIANALAGSGWQVHGIVLAGEVDARVATERELGQLWRKRSGERTSPGPVHFDAGAAGLGYDRHASDELDFMASLLRRHGLLFDPNYMLKAAGGLVALVRGGAIGRGEATVLLHSGGTYGLFADTPALGDYFRDRLRDFLAR